MQRFFYLIGMLQVFVFSAWSTLLGAENDPLIHHHVNVISGKLQLTFEDHVVGGAVPLPLYRNYTNYGVAKKKHAKWNFTQGWSFFSHTHLNLKRENDRYIAEIIEFSGALVTYVKEENKRGLIIMKPFVSKNQNSAVISYRLNRDNNRLHFNRKNKTATLHLSDGGRRIYKISSKGQPEWSDRIQGYFRGLGYQYLLSEEISASGQRTRYYYRDGDAQLFINKVNPTGDKIFSWLSLHQTNNYPTFTIRACSSDKKKLLYRGKTSNKRRHLHSITRDDRPFEKITYKKNKNKTICWLGNVSSPDREGLEVSYYFPNDKKKNDPVNREAFFKVKEIFKSGLKVASFSYEENVTEVRDSDNILTKYHHKDESFKSIERFDKHDVLYSTERFIWEGGNLSGKQFCDGDGKILSSQTFTYDDHKNLIHEGGSHSKWYKYNDRHLCVEERDEDGLLCQFEYLDGTDLLILKKTIYDNKVLLEESCQYDTDLLLIKKRSFDGYREHIESYIRDPQTGMIIEMDDGLQKTFYKYDDANNLIKEGTEFAYISMKYNKSGKMITKTFPLGGQNKYIYDEYGNPIEIKEVGSPLKQIQYNKLNRPTTCTVRGRVSKNTYDKKGRITLEEDYKGGTIAYTYNEFGRCIKKVLSSVFDEDGERYHPEFYYEYDVYGNVIAETSPSGAVTKTTYDIFQNPLQTTFADGSKVCNRYYKNGDLKETHYQDGTKTTFEYDPLHRPTKKITGTLEESWEYEGALLKRYSDKRGLITTFDYDTFGRKVTEDFEGRKKEFFYDVMGFLHEVKDNNTSSIEVHDIEGRVIETSQNGYNKICYEYDDEGRKSRAIKTTAQGEGVDQFFYDDESRLILHVDPLEGETQILYEDYIRTEIDSLGNQSVETFDALFRIIQKERKSPSGESLLSEHFFFDRAGNVKRRVTENPNLEVKFTYDIMGRLIGELEAEKKRTTFQYDSKGRLIRKIDPNGTCLDHRYDDLDRMVEMKSSDGTIWYEYIYCGLNLTEIKDLIDKKSLLRSYTKFGELSEEIGLSGYKTSWYYDTFGRKKAIYLPDNSSIRYTYQGSCMESVSRYNQEGEFLYEHRYTKFDPNHHVEEELLPLHLGVMKSSRDLMERPFKTISPYHKLELTYGPSSLVTKKTNSLTGDKDYSYDALNQLTKEGEDSYNFDALGNPKDYEINDLNQIVSTESENLFYDKNGNLIKRKGIKYSYDALNRLRKIKYKNGKKVTYHYDPFSRLVAKEIFLDDLTAKKFYLYDQDFEIGTIDEEGEIAELKVLGLGIQGDIGAAIALELFNEIYIPLHDLQGNITAILDAKGNTIEKYPCNAFGEAGDSEFLNPWRFASKRSEEHLIFFGLRFYDPSLKRWISPDPLGFLDSRNLYLYVQNSPLNRLDQFGLISNSLNFKIRQIPKDCPRFIPLKQAHVNPRYWTIGISPGSFSSPGTFTGTANIGGRNMTMMIKFPNNYNFIFTPEEKEQGYVNILTRVVHLIEGAKDKIAIVLGQHGMMNSLNDFNDFENMIIDKCPKNTTVMGIYNETNGTVRDLSRVVYGKFSSSSKGAQDLGAAYSWLNDAFDENAPKAKILHITHSEGASNFVNSVFKMPEKLQIKMQNRVHVCALGPVLAIPRNYGIDPQNYYSKADYLVKGFRPKENSGYNVTLLDATTPSYERIGGFLDHEFQGSTYQGAMEKVIQDFRTKGGIYEYQNRR